MISEQPLEEQSKTALLANGIFGLENVDKKDTQALAKATSARVVGSLFELEEKDIGTAEELSTGSCDS